MKSIILYLLTTLFFFFSGCSNHRLILLYESGDVAVNGGTDFSTGHSIMKTLEHTYDKIPTPTPIPIS